MMIDKKFIDSISSAIMERLMNNVNDTEALVKQYVSKHLERIVIHGLGFDDTWNRLEFRRTNGYSGRLLTFISQKAREAAQEELLKTIDIVKKKLSLALKDKNFIQEVENAYENAYSKELQQIISQFIKTEEQIIASQLTEIVENMRKNTEIVMSAQLDRMINEIKKC
jgi:hypothetical protein